MYLDGLYILAERLRMATIALNKESGNSLWKNILLQRPHLSQVRKPTSHNLMDDFGQSLAEAFTHQGRIARAMELRGSPTHQRHFQVYIEQNGGDPSSVVCYGSENPY